MIFFDLLWLFEVCWWVGELLNCTFVVTRCGPFGREDCKATWSCSTLMLWEPSAADPRQGSAAFRVF